MKVRCYQQGGVLVVSLIILLVMTLLGVNAITSSGLQERMVSNQKQVIEAAMAAEAGAVTVVQWLRAHPEAWGDKQVWKKNAGLPAEPPRTPNFGDGPVYWIEGIHFKGNTAVIVSCGGILVADQIIGQSAVTVILQNEDVTVNSVHGVDFPAKHGVNTGSDNQAVGGIFSGSVVQMIKANAVVPGDVNAINDLSRNDIPMYKRATTDNGFNSGDQETAVLYDLPRVRGMRDKIVAWKQLAGSILGSDCE